MRLVFWGFSSLAGSMWNSFYLHARKQEVKRGREEQRAVLLYALSKGPTKLLLLHNFKGLNARSRENI